MFRDFVSYLRNPEESKPFDFRPKSILSSFWLYLVAVMGLTILAAAIVYCLGEAFPALMQKKIVNHGDTPKWIVALLAPFLEEGACRLLLNRPSAHPHRHRTCSRSLPVSSSWKIHTELPFQTLFLVLGNILRLRPSDEHQLFESSSA